MTAQYTDRIPYQFDERARWIWAKDRHRKNDFVAFRKAFTLHEVPEKVLITVAVDTKYWMYINGRLAVFEGGLFRESVPGGGYADQTDITSYLREGENVIGLLCRYFGNGGRNNVDSGAAGLKLECPVLSIYSDGSFAARRHPAYYTPDRTPPSFLHGGDHIGYDTNERIGNFAKTNYFAADWPQAVVYEEDVFGEICLRQIPKLHYDAPHINSNILRTYENGEYVYTMKLPYAMAFTPIIQLVAKGGEKLWLTTDHEWVNGGPGDEHNRYHSQGIEYVCNAGMNHFDCLHYLYGERFVVRSKQELWMQAMGYHETGYKTRICGSFVTEDQNLNTLIEKAARTLYVCMRDNFMDCPDRERGQWIGDVSVQVPQVFYLLTESAQPLVKKAICDFLLLRDGDVLQGNVPGEHAGELPSQSLNAISEHGMIAQYYYFTHDESVLHAAFLPCVNYLKLWELDENGHIRSRDGSWAWHDHLYNVDGKVIENAWYLSALKFARKMAQIIGDRTEDAFLDARIAAVTAGMERFWNGECYQSGVIVDDRANALAVLSGACPSERYPQICSVLLKVFNATPYMENYILTALCEMGYIADAYNRMMARYYPLAQNRNSTLWEDFYIRGTANHAWTGAPVNIAFRYFLGLDSKDGFKTMTVSPAKELFDHINCCFPLCDKLHYVSYNRYTGELKQSTQDMPRY